MKPRNFTFFDLFLVFLMIVCHNSLANMKEKTRGGTMASEARKRIGYAETGVYQHINENGETEYQMYNTSNEPITTKAAKKTNEVGRIRVEMTEVVNGGVSNDGGNYNKNVQTKQFCKNLGTPSEGRDYIQDSSHTIVNPKDGLTPLQVLKNFVDNIAEDVRQHGNWLVVLGILGGMALIAGLAALVWLASIPK